MLVSRTLGTCFLIDPRHGELDAVFNELQSIDSFDEWPFGCESVLDEAYGLMVKHGLDASNLEIGREYQKLFIGPHHFEAPAWGSVYLDHEQVILGDSLVELRRWMNSSGIAVIDGKCEPEDHIGKMLMLLGWLAESKPKLIDEYLAEHLMPWAPRYLDLLEASAIQPFYKGLAVLTKTTLSGIVDVLGVTVTEKQLFH